jgi:hypothetical protein
MLLVLTNPRLTSEIFLVDGRDSISLRQLRPDLGRRCQCPVNRALLCDLQKLGSLLNSQSANRLDPAILGVNFRVPHPDRNF